MSEKNTIATHFEKQPAQEITEFKPASATDQVISLHPYVSSDTLLATAMVDIVNHKGICKSI